MKRAIVLVFVLISVLLAFPASAQSDITVYATAQRFEHGLMLWRSDTSYIWVLTDSGRVFKFPSSSYVSLPDNPFRGGALRPINGFGRVWGNSAAVRAAIGAATMSELGFDMRIVEQNGVTYLRQLDGTIYQMNPDDTWTFATDALPISPSPSIVQFDVQPRIANPGDTVTVTWSAAGLDSVRFEIREAGSDQPYTTLGGYPASGSTQITIPYGLSSNAIIAIAPGDLSLMVPRAELVVSVAMPPSRSAVVYAAYQPYEGGFMFWRSDTSGVYVFEGINSGTFSLFPYDYLATLPDNPPGSAPVSRVRPIHGFGRVWGNHSWVRDSLGWATTKEQGYTTMIGISGLTPVSFTLPDGRWVNMTESGTWSLP